MPLKKVSAIVLAGGNSTRMGQNKALLKFGSKTLVELVVNKLRNLFAEIIIVTNYAESYPMLKSVRFEKDCINTPVKNSLVGIYTGLLKSTNEYAFVVACDMPFLNEDLIKYMLAKLDKQDICVPYLQEHYQPLHAVYNKTCLEPIKNLLEIGDYKIINFYGDVNVVRIYEDEIIKIDPDLKSFMNVNTIDLYENLKRDCMYTE